MTLLTGTPDGGKAAGLHHDKSPGKEFSIYGCRASYSVRELPRINRCGDPKACLLLANALRRFGITITTEDVETTPGITGEGVAPVPWKGKCGVQLSRSGFCLEGYFFGDSLFYLPVLCELVASAIGVEPVFAGDATTEMSYGFDLVLDPAASRSLTQHLETIGRWERNGPHRFIATAMDDQHGFHEATIDVTRARTTLLSSFFHSGFLRPVDATAWAERHFLERVQNLPLPVRLLPLTTPS